MKIDIARFALVTVFSLGITPYALASSSQPVPLQPLNPETLQIETMPEPKVTLGGGGTMYSEEMTAKAAAAQSPAAGDPAPAAFPPATVGGAQAIPGQTIMDEIVKSKNHATLVKAIKAAGIDNVLSGTGPFTLFAPTDKAFSKIPENALADLMKPEGKDRLTKLLNYHVLVGQHDSASIAADIKAGGGKAVYQTVAGPSLTATMKGTRITLTDDNGNVSNVGAADMRQSNGVVHALDTVIIPK